MAFPSDLVRTKNWGTEVLTDSDLEGQFDLIINWVMAALNSSTGHSHDGTSNQGPKISATKLTISSQAQGDTLYASSSSAWARLGAGTKGQGLVTGGASANPSWADNAGVAGSYKNLKIVYTDAATVTVTADELVLTDNASTYLRIKSVSEAIAITTSGASGLVSALSEAANTIYYIWIARKSSDGTVNGFLSTTTSYTTILTQVDSGYDQVALVGCVGNNNSSNFISFIQEGKVYTFSAGALLAGSDTSGSWTAIDLTPANMSTVPGFVPPALSTIAFGSAISGGANNLLISNLNSESADGTVGTNKLIARYGGADGGSTGIFWRYHILTADTLYFVGAGTTAKVYLHGFEINKL